MKNLYVVLEDQKNGLKKKLNCRNENRERIGLKAMNTGDFWIYLELCLVEEKLQVIKIFHYKDMRIQHLFDMEILLKL